MSGTQQLNKQARWAQWGSLFSRNFNLHTTVTVLLLLLDDVYAFSKLLLLRLFTYLYKRKHRWSPTPTHGNDLLLARNQVKIERVGGWCLILLCTNCLGTLSIFLPNIFSNSPNLDGHQHHLMSRSSTKKIIDLP